MGDRIDTPSAEEYFKKYAEDGIGKGADRWMIKRQMLVAFRKEIFDLVKLRTGKELDEISEDELPEVRKKVKSIIHDSVMKWKKLCRMFEGYEQTQKLLKPDDLKLYDEIEDIGTTAEEANEQVNSGMEDGEEAYARLLDHIHAELISGKTNEQIAEELDMSPEAVRQIALGISIGKMVEAGLSNEEIAKSCELSVEEVSNIISMLNRPAQTSGYAAIREPTEEEMKEYLENLPEPEDLNLEKETEMVLDDLVEGVVPVTEKGTEDDLNKLFAPQAFMDYVKACKEKGMSEAEIANSLDLPVSAYRRKLSEVHDILRKGANK